MSLNLFHSFSPNHQHAGFNNNNFQHPPPHPHQHQQQLVQPIRPLLPNHRGMSMANRQQQQQIQHNGIGYIQTIGGANRYQPSGPGWQGR